MTMNRIINNADLVVEDMLKGWLAAHADAVVGTDNSRVVKRVRAPEAGKVGVVTGGGSGHEPAFLGYVGDGMVDAVAIGEIFSSPTAKSFLDAMRAANGGAGVACLYRITSYNVCYTKLLRVLSDETEFCGNNAGRKGFSQRVESADITVVPVSCLANSIAVSS